MAFRPLAGLNPAVRRIPVPLVAIAAALPGLWLASGIWRGGLGVDPVKALEHGFGLHALQFLLASLAVTPLLRLTGLNLLRFRRTLGLAAFFYALIHLLIWLSLDLQFAWGQITRDITRRPYLLLGAAAFVLLLPLAITSTDRALRRMGPAAWRRLHRLAYPAILLAALHYYAQARLWSGELAVYLALTVILLGYRSLRLILDARVQQARVGRS